MARDSFGLIRLPYRARNVKKLVAYLEPVRPFDNVFVWLVGRREGNYYCIVFGKDYKVVFEDKIKNDVLSGLKFKLKVPKGMVDDKVVWKARWIKSMFVVDEIKCDHIAKSLSGLY